MRRLICTLIACALVGTILLFSGVSGGTFAQTTNPLGCLLNVILMDEAAAMKVDRRIKKAPISDRSLSRQLFVTEKVGSSMSVFASIPENAAQFRNIFKADPSPTELAKLSQYNKAAQNLENINFGRGEEGTYLCRLDRHLQTTTSDYVALIGHNEGGMFYFPDGQRIDFSTLVQKFADNKKRPIFLSCKASRYVGRQPAPTTTLTYQAAIDITSKVQRELKNLEGAPAISINDVNQRIQQIINTSHRNARIQFLTKSVGGTILVVGVIVFLVEMEKSDERKKKRRTNSPS